MCGEFYKKMGEENKKGQKKKGNRLDRKVNFCVSLDGFFGHSQHRNRGH